MAAYPNPPVITGAAPTDGQVAVYDAASNTWVAQTPTGGTIDVPQAAIAALAAFDALTAVTVSAANASAPGVGYLQAEAASAATLANALKVAVNAVIADNVALHTKLATLRTQFDTLLTELATAGIIDT